jgi:hypothetical protein
MSIERKRFVWTKVSTSEPNSFCSAVVQEDSKDGQCTIECCPHPGSTIRYLRKTHEIFDEPPCSVEYRKKSPDLLLYKNHMAAFRGTGQRVMIHSIDPTHAVVSEVDTKNDHQHMVMVEKLEPIFSDLQVKASSTNAQHLSQLKLNIGTIHREYAGQILTWAFGFKCHPMPFTKPNLHINYVFYLGELNIPRAEFLKKIKDEKSQNGKISVTSDLLLKSIKNLGWIYHVAYPEIIKKQQQKTEAS